MDNQQENLSFHHARLHIFRLHLLFQPIGFGCKYTKNTSYFRFNQFFFRLGLQLNE